MKDEELSTASNASGSMDIFVYIRTKSRANN